MVYPIQSSQAVINQRIAGFDPHIPGARSGAMTVADVSSTQWCSQNAEQNSFFFLHPKCCNMRISGTFFFGISKGGFWCITVLGV